MTRAQLRTEIAALSRMKDERPNDITLKRQYSKLCNQLSSLYYTYENDRPK